MFTGIVEELGTVAAREDASDAADGDSIAVNGVCLTVVATGAAGFSVDVMRETLDRSALQALAPGDLVNLERSVTAHTRLGGHLVQGHVDGTGTVLERRSSEHWDVVRVDLPADLARYVVPKGSITVDGVSLTVSAIGPDWFEVSLIPTTLARTTLGTRQPGAAVNLEVDVIAKYVEKLMAARS
jgi:riboflavin synthase